MEETFFVGAIVLCLISNDTKRTSKVNLSNSVALFSSKTYSWAGFEPGSHEVDS
jgi:hypothetical protein